MEQRKQALLSAIVQEYIVTSRPVGSQVIVSDYLSDVSPATVRNEMAVLEEEGLIAQPHTSAGRIPTEAGWKLWLTQWARAAEPSSKTKRELESALDQRAERDERLKLLAKTLSTLSGEAIIVGFSRTSVYYTGLTQLFSQPEFEDRPMLADIGTVVDHLDETVGRVFDSVGDSVTVWVGTENPFGARCGTVVTRYHQRRGEAGLVGVLGPIRMPYEQVLGLVAYSCALIRKTL